MSRQTENPMAPPGDEFEMECDLVFYGPSDPRMNKFRINKHFGSLVHILDEELLESPSVSEGEIEEGVEESIESKRNSIHLKDTETLASLHALIEEVKNKHNLTEKVLKDEEIKPPRKIQSGSSIKISVNLKPSSLNKSRSPSRKKPITPPRRLLVEYPQSSSSSPSPPLPSSRKSPSWQRNSRPKSSIRSPSRSPTPARSNSSRYKSSKCTSSKRHFSPHHRSLSSKRCSSRSNIHTPSRSPSPAKSVRRCKSSKSCTSLSRSPTHKQALSPHRCASHGSSSHSSRVSNGSKLPSLDKRPKCHRSRCNKSLVIQKNIPIEDDDDYTKLLEEMKERHIHYDSDIEDELQVIEQNAAPIKELDILEKRKSFNETENFSQVEQNLAEKKLEVVNEELQPGHGFLQSKNCKEYIKSEFTDKKGGILNTFYCSSCQLSLNSEATWQSHITGKKHAKVLKLQTVHEVAKGSIAIPSNPALAIEEIPRFANPAMGMKHFRINDVSRLQPAIDNCRNYPILGLQSVNEIRAEKEVHYYCELCDSPCSAHSIMPHLTGYKHQLRFLKEIDPNCYEKNKSLPKKQYEGRLSRILFEHERKFGRGQIKVFEEREDPRAMVTYGSYFQYGSSGGIFSSIKEEKDVYGAAVIPANDECLDISKADFYCKLCDAHMNNINMWEAHVRGKRHLTNAKKIPGENISKVRSVKAPPGTRSMLDELLLGENAVGEIIVGLDFIKETQGPNGENYNCFLCGSCSTSFDIVNHLLLTKHRIRYLEKMAADGYANGITTISQIEMQDDYFRKHLIDEECVKMLEQYGPGQVEVYITKN